MFALKWNEQIKRLELIAIDQKGLCVLIPRCDGKSQYATSNVAANAARRLALKYTLQGDLRIYECGRHWHLGRIRAAPTLRGAER